MSNVLNGVLNPDELAFLAAVVSRVCNDFGYKRSSVEADLVATKALTLFQLGTPESEAAFEAALRETALRETL
ncbi:hypothetical protein BPNPMPFG_002427 [Mesorhizobium sp. AR07]|uniref:hypothetical protein n=1 Tax=Mesorhizobium sp. AR07 TaxID=2865838 RepID=UPI00215F97CF|nr:hypothetical protein [Mesorhizobium sp. AR07]UVK46723.1 hypothetical protein BPNPMPFG_002427 [Mesorhizobium sp. AR07]